GRRRGDAGYRRVGGCPVGLIGADQIRNRDPRRPMGNHGQAGTVTVLASETRRSDGPNVPHSRPARGMHRLVAAPRGSLHVDESSASVGSAVGRTPVPRVLRYRQDARSTAELNLGGLAPLDQAIPDLEDWAMNGPQVSRTSGGTGRRTGFRFRR